MLLELPHFAYDYLDTLFIKHTHILAYCILTFSYKCYFFLPPLIMTAQKRRATGINLALSPS